MDEGREMIRERLRTLFRSAGLPTPDEDLERMVSVVEENLASAARVRSINARYDEPAFGLPDRRRSRAGA